MNINEYYTPDKLSNAELNIAYKWDFDDAFPFLVYNGEVIVGQEGEKHSEMSKDIILRDYDISINSFNDILNDNYFYNEDECTYVTDSGDEIDEETIDAVITWNKWFKGEDNITNPYVNDTSFLVEFG